MAASNPDSTGSKLVSLFPATAPFAMPGRIVLGAATWWEPIIATALTLAAIVLLAGRVYTMQSPVLLPTASRSDRSVATIGRPARRQPARRTADLAR